MSLPEARKGLVKSLAEAVFGAEAKLAAAWAAAAHRRLFKAQWALKPEPEWFDHRLDLYWQWLADRNPLWLERGVFGNLALKGGDVLELACGDGFNARNFYSLRSRRVVACDFDSTAIAAAQKHNAAPNLEFRLADIRTEMPQGEFENIVWDAAIEHFTPDEIASIMANIKARLAPGGVLSGYTLVEVQGGAKHLQAHEYEFRDMQDLHRFLAPHFSTVKVFETVYASRHNLYFWASDGAIPFAPDWPRQYPRPNA